MDNVEVAFELPMSFDLYPSMSIGASITSIHISIIDIHTFLFLEICDTAAMAKVKEDVLSIGPLVAISQPDGRSG
jgi:hypothetical protein